MKQNKKQYFKWILSLALTLVMLTTLIVPEVITFETSAAAYTADTSWYDSSQTEFTLTTAAQFAGFMNLAKGTVSNNAITAAATTSFKGKTIKLGADIDLAPGWDATVTDNGSSISYSGYSSQFEDQGVFFEGTFDGQGHTVSGIYLYKDEAQSRQFGIFSVLNGATLKNVRFTNSLIVWNQSCGLGGVRFGGIVGDSETSTIENVYTDIQIVLKSNNNNGAAIGGISGATNWKSDGNGGKISNCVFAGAIYNTTAVGSNTLGFAKQRYIGQITALLYNADVSNCLAIGTVYTTGLNNTNIAYKSVTTLSTDVGGYNAVCPLRYNTTGSYANNFAGKQTSQPATSWVNNAVLGTYVPEGIYLIWPSYVDAPISSYTENAWPGSSFTISSASDLRDFRQKMNDSSSYGAGYIFKITADINLNPDKFFTTTVVDGEVQFPSYPGDDGNWTRINHFRGVLDGQGHTISGFYAERTVETTGFNGGIFWYLDGGTVKNLAITNSIFIGKRNSHGSRNHGFGAIAGTINGNSVIENVYMDAEVWYRGQQHYAFGGVAAKCDGACTISNFTFRGVYAAAQVDASDAYAYTPSNACGAGYIIAECNASPVLNNILVDVIDGETKGNNNMIHRQNSGTASKSNTYTSKQNSAIAGWTDFVSAIGTYTPSSVSPKLFFADVAQVPISQFDTTNDLIYKPGMSFTIGSLSDYNTFAAKITASANKGKYYTFNLTANINANPNWSAAVVVDGDEESGTVTFPKAAGNNWTTIPYFAGEFNGNGHYISGIYVNTTPDSHNWLGGLFNGVGAGTYIHDLLINNSVVRANASNAGYNVGGLVGYVDGADVTIENVYMEMDVFATSWSAGKVGGVVSALNATDGHRATFENIVFAGNVGITKSASASTRSASYPTTSTSSMNLSLLLAHNNNKTTTKIQNVLIVGSLYGNNAYCNNSNKNIDGLNPRADKICGATLWNGDGTLKSGDVLNVVWDTFMSGGGKDDTYGAVWDFDAIYADATDDIIWNFVPNTGASTNNALNAPMPEPIVLMLQLVTLPKYVPVTKSIQDYTGQEASGSIFIIYGASDLAYAAELSQDDVTFAGYTLKLDDNIDLNPNWQATVTISNSKATMPNLPLNMFRGFKSFAGTFDGQNHYIAGLYMAGIINNGGFTLAPFDELLTGATIQNLKLTNGLIYANDNGLTYTDTKVSGLVARVNGSDVTLMNIYNELEVWAQTQHGHKIAGFVSILGSSADRFTMANCVFAGKVGDCKSSGATIAVPGGSNSAKVSQLIADGGYKSTTSISSCNMSGTTYVASGAQTPTEITINPSTAVVDHTGDSALTAPHYTVASVFASAFPTNIYSASDTPTVYEQGQDTYVYYYKYVSKADNFDVFGTKLANAGLTGYTKVANYQIGNNYYAVYDNPSAYTLFVSYIAYGTQNNGRGRLFIQPSGSQQNYNKTQSTDGSVCEAQIWQLNVDNAWSTSAGGMGYIIRMTDGRYIVIDGGYESDYDARNIYKVLKENDCYGADKPVIAGWFITHLHDDHYGALVRFANLYAADVTVEAFYYNFPSVDVTDKGSAVGEASDGISITDNKYPCLLAMTAFKGAAQYSKIHSGQTFGFSNLTATVMYTHEEGNAPYYQSGWKTQGFDDGNDTSTVVKFTFNPGTGSEQTLMINGDARSAASVALIYGYAEADVQADIIQVSHHGFYGLSSDAYEFEDKSYKSGVTVKNKSAVYLWPQDIVLYSKSGSTYSTTGAKGDLTFYDVYTTSGYNGADSFIASRAKEVIPAYKNECLTIPYTPNTLYSQTYWSTSSYKNITNVYNTKSGTKTNWDGSASGLTAEELLPIKSWWNDGNDTVYNIDTVAEFYEFVRLAKTHNFSGKTVNLNCDIVVNGFDGKLIFGANASVSAMDGSTLRVWTPIPEFAGTFNGQNHTISGIYSNVSLKSAGSWGNAMGGFIQKLNGGTIQNLNIVKSAMVGTNNNTFGGATMAFGGFVGESAGTSAITNCNFLMDVYVISNYAVSFSGIADYCSSGTLNISTLNMYGDVALVSVGGELGAGVTLTSGQQVYGPTGIMGRSNGTTTGAVTLNNVYYWGTRTASSSTTANVNADIYCAATTKNVTLTGTNYGTTSRDETHTDIAVAVAESRGYVYVPQMDTYAPGEIAKVKDPIYSQSRKNLDPDSEDLTTVDVRLAGTITNTPAVNGTAVGFDITLTRSSDRKTAHIKKELYTVFKSITAGGDTITASQLGGDYIYALVLTNMSVDVTYTLTVKTIFVDGAGNETQGAPVTVTYLNGEVQ